jgi:hypothetical protein
MAEPDVEITFLAAKHHGVFSRAQAIGVGFTSRQIDRRLSSRRWELLARGVYRMAGAPPSWRQDAYAAWLAAPSPAFASHLTAAALHGAHSPPPPKPHVTVPWNGSVRLPLAVVHRSRHGVSEWVTIDSIPTTTLTRTLIDCAGVLGPRRTRTLTDSAFYKGRISAPGVDQGWDDVRIRPGRAGEPKLRQALGPWRSEIRPGSPAEARLVRQLQQWGFPEPECQIVITDSSGRVLGRVDLGWRRPKLGIEYDSEEHHGESAWESDEARHVAITAAGWRLHHADKADLRPGATRLRTELRAAWNRDAAA